MCVADRIAEYCEAYLMTPGLCKSGTKCCVSRDIYPDKPPADLYVPTAHYDTKVNKTTTPKPYSKITEKTTSPEEPAKSKINPAPKPTNTVPPKQKIGQSGNPQGTVHKSCEGECVNGLFALFCDDVDSDAFCPNEGSCCVTGGTDDTKQEIATTTRRPATPVRSVLCLLIDH